MSDLESSLSNINLDFSNINIKKTLEINLSGTWSSVKISGDAKYQIASQTLQNGQVFISDSYGLNWKLVNFFTESNFLGYFVSVSISKDGKYQAVVQKNGYIATSTDYGKTWRIIQNCLYKSPSGNIVYNMLRDWSKIDISGNGKYQTAVSYYDDPTNGGYIFRSDDYGISWVDVTPYDMTGRYYTSVSICYSGKYQVVVNNSNPIIYSDDYGKTWYYPLSEIYSTGLAINSSQDENIDGKYRYSIYILDFDAGIKKSYDYGETWDFVNFITEENFFLLLSITTSSNGQYVYCLVQTFQQIINTLGVMVSHDYGETWIFTDLGIQYNYVITFNTDITNFGISTSENGSSISLTIENNKIYISNDYGLSFNNNNDSPIYNYIYPVKTSSSGQYQLSFITNREIILSKDYGNIWNKINIIKVWVACTISLTGQYQCCIDSTSSIYISDDYGDTWNLKTTIYILPIIKMSGDGKYYVSIYNNGFNPQLYVSIDYGNTWYLTDYIAVFIYDIEISLSGKYQTLLSYSSGIIISDDYGQTWKMASQFDYNYYWKYISMSSSGKFQLICTDIKPFYYSVSSDYGDTWILNSLDNFDIVSIDKTIVSSTGQYQFISSTDTNLNINIYYSTDYGKSWKLFDTTSIDNSSNISSISSTGQTVVLSNQNNIYQIYLNSI